MKKTILIAAFLLGGCTGGGNADTETDEIKTRCLDGVSYYLFNESFGYVGSGYMAPKYNRDGSLALCAP